jgi:hypothetical protein
MSDTTQVSEMERDASRYRWLRQRHVDAGFVECREIKCYPETAKAYVAVGGYGRSLDEQIDRELARSDRKE